MRYGQHVTGSGHGSRGYGNGQQNYRQSSAANIAAKRARAVKFRSGLQKLKKEERAAFVVAAIVHKGKKSLEQSKSTGNLLKSVNIVSTLASVVNRIPVSDDESLVTKTMKDGQSDNKWGELWKDVKKPTSTIAKKIIAHSREDMVDILNHSSSQISSMNGDQVGALAGGLAMVLAVPSRTSLQAAVKSVGIGLKAAKQLQNITTQRPYPAKEEIEHGSKGVVKYLGKLLETTTPDSSLRMPKEISEDTMSTPTDASDTHYEENLFLMRKNAKLNKINAMKQAKATKKVLPKVKQAIEHVLNTMESMVVKNQKPLTYKTDTLSVAVQKKSPNNIGDVIRTEEFEFKFVAPSVGTNMLESLKDPVVDTVVFKNNPFVNSADGSSDDITSSVLELTLKDNNQTIIDVPLKLKIRSPSPAKENIYHMKETMSGPSQMMYHRFLLRNTEDSTFIYVRTPPQVTNVTGYLRSGRAPTMKKFDVKVVGLKEEWKGQDAYKIIIPAHSLKNGTVYLALKMTFLPGTVLHGRTKRSAPASSGNTSGDDYMFSHDYIDEDYMQFNTSDAVYAELEDGEYGLVMVTDGCRVWDPEKEIWDAKACEISPYSNPKETFCTCAHAPGRAFATTFYVPPNTIDFSLVFTKFDASNAAVYGLIIGIISVYILGLIWARRQDRKDVERWRVGYLVDNLTSDKYFYLLQVHTGLRKNSGTESRISFVLAGEQGDTGVRILSDGKRSIATGSVMNYILAVPGQLADLSYLRIWHDNSGPGSKSSWFLNKIVTEDLQTQQRYIFACDHWLAVDKEDGIIDRVLPVSVKDDFMTFDKLFSEHARLNITDTHLWLSIFMRPERCTFSRVQRVSCCLALLFLMMISSAMFFKSQAEKEDEETIRHEVKIGGLRFSMTSFYVSLVSLMVTMPPTILVVMLFKSSKPKMRKDQEIQVTRPQPPKNRANQDEEDVLTNRYKNKPLPHVFVYIAWVLLALIVMTCGFFLILYSMQWGKAVSEEWLTSFFMCFAQSVVVMDPLKVVILAVLLAFCLRDPFDSKGEIDMQRVQTEAQMYGKAELDLMCIAPEPLPESVLAKARRRRRKEVRAQSVFLELIQYVVFLFAIYSLSFGNRDDRSFMIHEHIDNNLYTGSVNLEYPFEGIQSYDDFFTWAQSTFIPRLFPETDIRGSRLPWRKRLFFSDLINFRVGPARIRQLRMPRHQSPFYGSQYNTLVSSQKYYGAYSLFSEDVSSYCLNWKKRPCPIDEDAKSLTSPAWKYTSSNEVWGIPVAGQYKIYSGGGYMLELNVNYDVSKDMLQELYDNSWLDRRTRAVFVEFTLYNAFVNIMAHVRLSAEFPETGSTIIWHDIMTFRLDQHHGSLGAYVLLCEIVIAIILVIFTINLMKKLYEQKLAYFLHVWQTLDLLTVIWCLVAVVFYVIREVNASETLSRFRDNPKKFVNFQHIAIWDNLFVYALGALVFSTTIRILRILGYNKRVTIIAAVLSNSARDLTGFGIVFGIVFFAYVLSGYILFSAHYYGYHTIYDSMFTIFTYMLGKNIMARLMLIAPIWAQIYFSTLVFFIIFVLLTMFQAIMNNSMTVVRDNLKKIPPPYGLVNVVLNIYRALIRDWLPDSFFKNQKGVVVVEEHRRGPTYQALSQLRDQLELAVTVKGAFKRRPLGKSLDLQGKLDKVPLEAKILRAHGAKEFGVDVKMRQLGVQDLEDELTRTGQETRPNRDNGPSDQGDDRTNEKRDRESGTKQSQQERESQEKHVGREKGKEEGGPRSRDPSAHELGRHGRPQRRRPRIVQ
ncbi:polycystic kidney disease protein 1-like 2 [Haliotis rufescens]|uniref:polycystic kidney disease protein 1-like 2 n=1 Tax=Haliotis rufescens TaxID=6454 RepID=UPI00201F1B95|nr:polycystic kidney disease protein 1-like 2 [Haliotis rufescens]